MKIINHAIKFVKIGATNIELKIIILKVLKSHLFIFEQWMTGNQLLLLFIVIDAVIES